MKIFWGYFEGSSQNCTLFRGHFYSLRPSFLKVNVQNGGYLFGFVKLQILFLVLENHDIFGMNGR